jgi:hypothetical protein
VGGARDAWEKVAALKEGDGEADALLPTIYQRLGDLSRSDLALERARKAPDLPPGGRAEIHALGKQREGALDQGLERRSARQATRGGARLGAPHPAYQAYARGFEEDPGISTRSQRTGHGRDRHGSQQHSRRLEGRFDDAAQADARLSGSGRVVSSWRQS